MTENKTKNQRCLEMNSLISNQRHSNPYRIRRCSKKQQQFFYQKSLINRSISLTLAHTFKNTRTRWVSEIELSVRLKQPNRTLKQQLRWNLMIWNLTMWNHWLHLHENIIYNIKQTFFILRTNICRSHQMATTKSNWKIFSCIIVNKNFSLHEFWRRHYSSTSRMVGCHPFRLVKIPINKQEMYGIKISQRIFLYYVLIFLHPESHPNSAPTK